MFQWKRISILLAAVAVTLGTQAPADVSAGTYATCIVCHALPLEQATGQLGLHNGYAYNPLAPETACANCHTPVPHDGPSYPAGYWNWSLNPASFPPGPSVTGQMCYSCHSPLASGTHAVDKIPMLPSPLLEINSLPSILPLRRGDGFPDQNPFQGGLVCSTCHDPHDPSYALANGKPGYLRVGDSPDYMRLCTVCHQGDQLSAGHDLMIDSTSASVALVPQPAGPYDVQFTVRNRGNLDSPDNEYVLVEAEDQFGVRSFVDSVSIPRLLPDQSVFAATTWEPAGWHGPVTFRFILPFSSLRPVPGPRVIVRSFAGPAAPTGLQVGFISWDSVSLIWNHDNFSPGTAFNVFRNGVQVNGGPITTLGYLDSGLAPETPHTYTVQAVALAGGLPSPMSNRVGAQTLAAFVVRVPEDYPTIQAAISAAGPGTSIHVAAGTYDESLIFYGKNQVTVKGVDANGCIIEAAAPGVVDLWPDGVNTLAGFTLRNTELILHGADVAYGCVFNAAPGQPQTVVSSSGGFIANSVFDTEYNAIAVDPARSLTLANCILLGFDPIAPLYQPPPTVLLLNNLFEFPGLWQDFPGEQNLVGDPGFCPGSYFTGSELCRDRGTELGQMTAGPPDIGAFEAGFPYTSQPPSGLVASRQAGVPPLTDIQLSWVPPADANCLPPQEYLIYRSAVPDFPAASLSTPLATIPDFDSTFVDIGIPPSQVYYYQVRASNIWGPTGQLVSAPSNTAAAEVQANAPPVAIDDAATTRQSQPLTLAVLANDSDPDGDAFHVVGVGTPLHGSAVFDANDLVVYTPEPDYFGTDSFSYTVADQVGGLATAVVSVEVLVNLPPVAAADSYGTLEDTILSVPAAGVLGNDSDPDGEAMSAMLVAWPEHGTLLLNIDGSFVYTPAPDYHGPDFFVYCAIDRLTNSNPVVVMITVTGVNDPPLAAALSLTTTENAAIPVTLAATDVDGNPLTYAVATGPANGSLSGAAPNLTYTPAPGFFGTDGFTFRANDGLADSNLALVSLDVTPAARQVSATAGTGGTIAPAGVLTVPHGSVQVFTVSAAADYSIAAVTGCEGSLDGSLYTTSPITADCAVAASFAVNSYKLSVGKAGVGSGIVTSAPPGIDCGAVCSADFDSGTAVTLTATPESNSLFAGWSGGGCSGTGTCTIAMETAQSVTATFTPVGLTVTAPNGGERWRRGSTQTIRWTYTGAPGSSVKIELLKNGTVNRTISKGTSSGSNGAGSYNWRISSSQATGSEYKIRVTSQTRSTYSDTSDANFTISRQD